MADTLQRDVQAIMAQTGWQRSISRQAQDQNSFTLGIEGAIGGGSSSSSAPSNARSAAASKVHSGSSSGTLKISSTEAGTVSETATGNLDIINYDVRSALAASEQIASRASSPEHAFTAELSRQILGKEGLRNRYLGEADGGRGTFDINAPVTSMEQSSILGTGRGSLDRGDSPVDGDSQFKQRQ